MLREQAYGEFIDIVASEQLYAHSSFDPEFIEQYFNEARRKKAAKFIRSTAQRLMFFRTEDFRSNGTQSGLIIVAAPRPLGAYTKKMSKTPRLAVVSPDQKCHWLDSERHIEADYQVRPPYSRYAYDLRYGMNPNIFETLQERATLLSLPAPEQSRRNETFRPAVRLD